MHHFSKKLFLQKNFQKLPIIWLHWSLLCPHHVFICVCPFLPPSLYFLFILPFHFRSYRCQCSLTSISSIGPWITSFFSLYVLLSHHSYFDNLPMCLFIRISLGSFFAWQWLTVAICKILYDHFTINHLGISKR